MDSKHLDARIEILTDGSDKTGGAAIFLTIRRCISHQVECPQNEADSSQSSDADGDDDFYYKESLQDTDDGVIVARYNLSGIPSLTGRLSSDQAYKLLQNGAFNAILVPSLVQSLDCDGGTMRGECIGGLPALFLNLIQAGYKIAGGYATNNNNNKLASMEYSSDSSVDCEKRACTNTSYNDVSIIGPAGLNDTIDGLLDTMFGNARRRPSLRLCEVPHSDEQWYEVYEDSYVCMWAQSVPHDTSKSTCFCQTCSLDTKESDACGSGEYSLAFIVMLRTQVGSNKKEHQHSTKRQKTTSSPDHSRPYSFAIITQPSPSFHCEGTCQKCGTTIRNSNFRTWDVFRNLPQEIASNRNQSSFLLDFILHLNPSCGEIDYQGNNSMDEHETVDAMQVKVEKRRIDVPSWIVDAKLAHHHLALLPTETPDKAHTDKGLLIRAWHRSKILHNALPFAFPLNMHVAEQDCQNPDKNEKHVSGVSTTNALKLSSCTSVTLEGWGSTLCHDPFTFLSRSDAIRSRCHERSFTNWNEISSRDNGLSSQCKGDFTKIVESLKCAFSGETCYCNECDGMQQKKTVDDNEIDLDDSSCEDEDKESLVIEDVTDVSSSSSTIDVNSAHLIFLGTGCATPSPHRSSSGIGLFMPTSTYRAENSSYTDALALSAIIECGEGTLSSLSRHIQSFSNEPSYLDSQLSQVNFIWISHAHLDHYGDLSSVVQAVANAKRKVRNTRPVVVIAPPKVLKYLRVMLKSHSSKGQDRQYIGVTHRDFQMSPFAGHVRSMIYDGRLMMPSSSQLDNAGQATNNYTSYSRLFKT